MEDIIQSVTPEELTQRQQIYLFNIILKNNIVSQTEDGSYIINGDVWLDSKGLTNFKHMPYKIYKVNGKFDCSVNPLTSLEGCPQIVNGSFYCDRTLLKDLKGSPEIVNENFVCSYNNLTSIEGMPATINGNVYCRKMTNGHKFTIDEISKISKVKGKIYV